MRKIWAGTVVAAMVVGLVSSPAAAKKPDKLMAGCLIMTVAYNGSGSILSASDNVHAFGKVSDGELRVILKALLRDDDSATTLHRLQKWCRAHYPKVDEIQSTDLIPVTTTRASAYVPVPTDFQIDLVTTKKECFGSAGCNVVFRIDVKYLGARTPDPSKTFTVIYDVTGGESTKTNSFTLTGTSVKYDAQELVSTPSEDSVLTATATRVLT